ncbi:MAG: hypothetical protein C5B51_27690 [Terriglobia bacterium]|nr:MAG: hypothetical protein C5B51_27690 [Terriglobia bacterium]
MQTAVKLASTIVFAAIGWLAAGSPASAHHAFAVEFDATKQVNVSGVVTKVEWSNPHAYFYLDVKSERGSVVNWTFETAGPNMLAKLGWDRKSLKVGDQVTVVGYRARGNPTIASARTVVLADGRRVSAGSSVDGGPQR